MQRASVIDIGTNSVKLTIADLGDNITVVREDSKITRLGKNVDSNGRLNPEAIQKTLLAIQDFVNVSKYDGASSIVLAGTSALRDAANGNELVDAVQSTCGLDIEIISGDREATLAFTAISGDPCIVNDPSIPVAVFDIGGGSTELVWGIGSELKDHVSINIGAVRLTERHFKTDPPTDAEFSIAAGDGADAVRSFFAGKSATSSVCGVGGTAATFAALEYSSKDVHGKEVTVDSLRKSLQRLRSMPLSERRTLPFLEPERADIIIAGGAILIGLMGVLNASSYRVSLRGMRYGLLLEQMIRADVKNGN